MDLFDLNVLSLGAGVQSTTLYLMALEGETPAPDCAIFADTGWEPSAVYAHLRVLERVGQDRLPIHRVQHGRLRDDVLQALHTGRAGYTCQPPFYVRNAASDGTAGVDRGGMLWRKCTQEYKINPIQRQIRALLGYRKGQHVRKRVRQWFGITTDEAHRQKDSRVAWIANHYPLIDAGMSRQDCADWLTDHGWTVPPKSACIGCPYHANAYWIELQSRRPDEWSDAVEFDAMIRQGLPGVAGEAYLHRRMLPLPEAVAAYPEKDQLNLFGSECEGVCGV